MRLGTEEDLVEAARELGPVIREHADEAEHERRPSPAVMHALREAGFFRMYTPRSLGGLEVDPPTCARVVEEVSGFDSAAGWTIMTANATDWWYARLPDEGAEEIYADSPDAIVAAAFNPPMQAVQVDGGYRVSGDSPLASNISDADWLFVPAMIVEDGQPRMRDGQPEVVATTLRAGECEVLDTWYALGMRGTDSNDVAVHGVFVPAHRTFPVVPEFKPGSHYQGPLYRMPAMGAQPAVFSAIGLAIARRAITEITTVAMSKTPFGSATTLRERASAQARLGRAEALLRSARALLYASLGEAWERTLAGERFSLEQKADLLLAGVHAFQNSAAVTQLMYDAGGTTGIYRRSPLERHFRDMQVLKQHGFLSESRYETVGQVRLGLPPDLPFVAF